MEKQLAIFEVINNTAQEINKLVADFNNIKSKSGKRRLKGNNYRKERRVKRKLDKKRKAALAFSMAITAAMGAMQMANIMSQPIPKFNKGGNYETESIGG